MKEAGCRLLIVGYESGDEQILRNIKKGATIDMAQPLHRELPQAGPGDPRRFHRRPARRNARDAAQHHRFRQELDVETIQVSIAHAFPGTEFYDFAKKNNLVSINMADDEGHQLPNVIYPGILEKDELVEWVERFYGEYYFRPKAAWRIVRKSMFDNHERKRLYKEAKDYLSLRSKAQEVRRRAKGRPLSRRRTRLILNET